MGSSAFSLKDNLVAYGFDGQAARASQPFYALRDMRDHCILGIAEFADDRSVHADHWERHSDGDEILCVLEGRLLATVDRDGATEDAVIEQGQAFIVPRRSWHRLRVLEPGRLLFFTPTAEFQLRPHATEGTCRTSSTDDDRRQTVEGQLT